MLVISCSLCLLCQGDLCISQLAVSLFIVLSDEDWSSHLTTPFSLVECLDRALYALVEHCNDYYYMDRNPKLIRQYDWGDLGEP